MSSNTDSLSTFQRSCQHWSEDGRLGMEAFYRLAAKDYRLLAERVQWDRVIAALRTRFHDQLRVLDVACGSGQFPSALQEFGGWSADDDAVSGLTIPYALLDPSQFSIDTAKEKLHPPFVAADEFCCTAQDLTLDSRPFPIVWATHALYCVPASELELAMQKVVAATDPTGLGFIAHASESSHYLRFHHEYLKSSHTSGSVPFCTGEEVIAALRGILGDDRVHCQAIEYEGNVELEDTETAQRYLQRCLFDDDITLDQMQSDATLSAYLDECRDTAAGVWRFRQRTWMIFYGDSASEAPQWINEGSD